MSRLNTSRNPLLQLVKLMPRPTMHADFLRSIRGSGVSKNNFVEVEMLGSGKITKMTLHSELKRMTIPQVEEHIVTALNQARERVIQNSTQAILSLDEVKFQAFEKAIEDKAELDFEMKLLEKTEEAYSDLLHARENVKSGFSSLEPNKFAEYEGQAGEIDPMELEPKEEAIEDEKELLAQNLEEDGEEDDAQAIAEAEEEDEYQDQWDIGAARRDTPEYIATNDPYANLDKDPPEDVFEHSVGTDGEDIVEYPDDSDIPDELAFDKGQSFEDEEEEPTSKPPTINSKLDDFLERLKIKPTPPPNDK